MNLQQGRSGGEAQDIDVTIPVKKKGDKSSQKKSSGTAQSSVFLRKSFLGQATGWGRIQ